MEMTRDTNVSAAEWNDTLASVLECSPPPSDPLWHPPQVSSSPAETEEEKNDWKLTFSGAVPPAVPVEMNHPRSPTWDETVNWSKSTHRSTASGSSVGEDDSLASTQLFPAPDTLHRVVSYDSSTFSSAGLEEMGLLTPPPTFFTPRRRLNSIAPDVPDAVTVSFGGGNNWSDTEDEDRLPITNINTFELDSKTSIHRGWKERLLRYFVISGGGSSHRASTNRRAPPTRRNLLFLFLVAVYTTFGLASPHLRAAIPQDALTLGPLPAMTIAPVLALEMTDQESSQRKALRGSLKTSSNASQKGHLSFARGAKNPRQLLYRPRRDELNDFLHQSAVQEEEAASSAWYFNCLVLICIALWWTLKKERPSSSSSIRRI